VCSMPVRSVQAAPQPLCILATDTQLKQLQLCCTDPNNFSVLCIDPTFNLGSFYVTPMVFLHKAVVSKCTQKHPVFLGPILIHQRLNMEDYSYFAHHIQILLPALRSIKALGTDGELLDMPSQMLFTCAVSSTFKTTVTQNFRL